VIRERAFQIGRPVPLTAISSEPADFSARRPALLLLNSGVMHHVGSCRLSVKIARAAAERGLLALRFDFAGIGDSEPRRGTLSATESALQQLGEVMDFLQQQRGVDRFILYGLCSGAMASFNMACRDPRVVGIAQINGYAYTTWRYHLEHYLPHLLDRARWSSFLRRSMLRMIGRYQPPSAESVSGIDRAHLEVPTFDQLPPRDKVAEGLRAITARGVRLYTCFTGGEPHYNYREQYRDCFRDVDFGELLELYYYPEANHIITQPKIQAAVIGGIVDWACRLAAKVMAGDEPDAVVQDVDRHRREVR
jgi:pimeloyl-ACP methyl ester carboxylesterase